MEGYFVTIGLCLIIVALVCFLAVIFMDHGKESGKYEKRERIKLLKSIIHIIKDGLYHQKYFDKLNFNIQENLRDRIQELCDQYDRAIVSNVMYEILEETMEELVRNMERGKTDD